MPDVYNWQIGHTMAYPYPEAHPRRQCAAVFNINRCIGLPDLHWRVQGRMDVLAGAGDHVVEQHRDAYSSKGVAFWTSACAVIRRCPRSTGPGGRR